MRGAAVPSDKVGSLLTPELKRNLDTIDQHWHQYASLRRDGGLVLDPLRRDRIVRPQYNNVFSRFEFALNYFIEDLARLDLTIPPHGPASRG